DAKYRHFAFKTLEYYSVKLSKTPIYFPYLLDQAHRYIKEDRIVKGKKERLTESIAQLATVTYPFTKRCATNESDDFLICGLNSCFANAKEAKEIDNLIQNSF
ncbi:MAG: thioredoxin domain-containing protein, partial [Sulfurimonadaceae bacterium]